LLKVKPSTLISSKVGNIYTGSIYLGLTSLLEQGLLHPGQWVGFGSYGSGCTAMFFSGVVQPGIESLAPINALNRLEERTEISLDDYQLLHEGQKMNSIISPSCEFALLEVDRDGYRHYDFIS
jgi:hydroxymethylglutaryl-CoA synthase